MLGSSGTSSFKFHSYLSACDTCGQLYPTFKCVQLSISLFTNFLVLPRRFVALAICAIEHNFVCPTISKEDDVLLIEEGRNPLQELCVDGQFIPNSTEMGAGTPNLARTRLCKLCESDFGKKI